MALTTNAGGIPLSIIGVPSRIKTNLQEIFKTSFARSSKATQSKPVRRFMWLDFDDTALYYKNKVIIKVLEELNNKLISYIKGHVPIPAHISLIYIVPSKVAEHEALLEHFCTFARCRPIDMPYRDFNAMRPCDQSRTFINAIKSMTLFNDMQKSKIFSLPLRNFMCGNMQMLRTVCMERIINTPNEFPIRMPDITIKNCRNETRCTKCNKALPPPKKVALDARNLCFVEGAAHGGLRDYPNTCSPLLTLESLYRFGWPIHPASQCDVQKPRNRTLDGVVFECQRTGKIEGDICKNADHANIYCNDVVNIIE